MAQAFDSHCCAGSIDTKLDLLFDTLEIFFAGEYTASAINGWVPIQRMVRLSSVSSMNRCDDSRRV